MTTYTTITGLGDDFPAALAVLPHPLTDGRRVLACVHQPTPHTSERAYTAVYTVDPLTWQATRLGQSEPHGKDIACALAMVDTTVELYVTEPPPGGSGAASEVHRYAWPVGARMVAVDQPARTQAMAAQHVANAAWAGVQALDGRVDALEE